MLQLLREESTGCTEMQDNIEERAGVIVLESSNKVLSSQQP